MNLSENRNYVAYEYKEVTVRSEQVSFYLDCYKNFGWNRDENFPDPRLPGAPHMTTLRLKRDRKIINHMELTRLQRNFEACLHEMEMLEKSETSRARVIALVTAVFGTAFMAGSTFAATHRPPIVWLCILLAVPGFLGWILPYFLYHWAARKKTREIQPLIEAKHEEIYGICEKGHSLL